MDGSLLDKLLNDAPCSNPQCDDTDDLTLSSKTESKGNSEQSSERFDYPHVSSTLPRIDHTLSSSAPMMTMHSRQVTEEVLSSPVRPHSSPFEWSANAASVADTSQNPFLARKKMKLSRQSDLPDQCSWLVMAPSPPIGGHAWMNRVTLFHEMCRTGSSSILLQMLEETSDLATFPAVLTCKKRMYDPISNNVISKVVKEKYTYPLHRAIFHRAEVKVIEKMVEIAPNALLMTDGAQQESPLHILLKNDRTTLLCSNHIRMKYSFDDVRHLSDVLLLARPCIAALQDRHGNTPLHNAARWSSERTIVDDSQHNYQDILRHVHLFNPSAVHINNMQGKLRFNWHRMD